jgi:hypothetical protein
VRWFRRRGNGSQRGGRGQTAIYTSGGIGQTGRYAASD